MRCCARRGWYGAARCVVRRLGSAQRRNALRRWLELQGLRCPINAGSGDRRSPAAGPSDAQPRVHWVGEVRRHGGGLAATTRCGPGSGAGGDGGGVALQLADVRLELCPIRTAAGRPVRPGPAAGRPWPGRRVVGSRRQGASGRSRPQASRRGAAPRATPLRQGTPHRGRRAVAGTGRARARRRRDHRRPQGRPAASALACRRALIRHGSGRSRHRFERRAAIC
jgi:hypothetical protein